MWIDATRHQRVDAIHHESFVNIVQFYSSIFRPGNQQKTTPVLERHGQVVEFTVNEFVTVEL